MNTSFSTAMAVAAILGLTACAAPGADEDEDVGTSLGALESENSLTSNSLTSNSLTSNSLTSNSLTSNGLTSNPDVYDALKDANARSVLWYIVGCALPAGVHFDITIDGTTYGYDGQLGIAGTWGQEGGHCDASCMAEVSSCVLSRVNYLGQKVPISVRGYGLSTTPAELSSYPNPDGVYYGNIFSSPQIREACLPPGVTQLTRVCGSDMTNCVVTSQGPCTQVCTGSHSDGSWDSCRDASNGTVFNRPIAVFLQ